MKRQEAPADRGRSAAKLPLLFAQYADNGDHDALAALFTENCKFARPFQPDHPFHGRDRVQAIFRDRPPILVRHIVTNVLVEVISRNRGARHQLPDHAVQPRQRPSRRRKPAAIYVGGFEDHYVKTEGELALHEPPRPRGAASRAGRCRSSRRPATKRAG